MVEAQSLASASDQLRRLAEQWEARPGLSDAIARLRVGEAAALDGLWGASRALLAATLARACPAPVLLVVDGPALLDAVADDLALFTDRPHLRLAAWEAEPDEHLLHDEIYAERIRGLKTLLTLSATGEDAPIVVTSIQSLIQPVPDRASLAAATRTLGVGDSIDPRELLKWLSERGFHHSSAVELPGEFAARGGIIDLFAPDWEVPARIELLDDEIESIRCFDVATQRSLAGVDRIDVTVLEPGAGGDHLTSYLPEESWILLLEPAELETAGVRFLEQAEAPETFHSTRAVLQALSRFPTLTAEAVSTSPAEDIARLRIDSVEQFSGDVHKVRDELQAAASGDVVIVVCHNEAEAKRLDEVFAGTALATEGRLHLITGRLSQGFRLLDESLIVISGDELFHRTDVARPARRQLSRTIDTFLDLREGDLVVHLAHGVARYRGMQLLEKEDHAEEHLELEFGGGTKVYVPAQKIHLVQKYVGATKSRPTLAKIGGKTWVRQKEMAEQAVTDLASEMLDLQAVRRSRPGIAFPPDSEWQKEFAASFPYRETEDQLDAIDAIGLDMQASRPMDRLLCGDVGFGKTELAIRAAFKAVDAGYQVALLAPTTILVEQHYRTFTSRMAEFPFEIARLSRFCGRGEQRKILKAMAEGSIDIVIGTHRLAQRDVALHNLGLVIIDEEQRFGVEVKERLKALRSTVDVMTMTATPIPRTLHMSLLGLRDISNLQIAPQDRISVETRVVRFDPLLVRRAVLRELSRGGQIFYVHNRVGDIEAVAANLQRIVPEATIGIGHGQMPEGRLEQVMVDFVAHRFDLLLATTIVESGLDIPNANTIFIDDAERYGLAELHQLRGRVGRYKHRAYCYLLLHPKKHLSPVAARRLRAIEEFSQLGAGFAIAMRDLEIRGAGNILGTRQSGHIAAVGYELYCQLLEQAVRRLKSLPPAAKWEVNVDLPLAAYIPRSYVSDLRLKIDLYRRIGRIRTREELESLAAELDDRFAHPPPPVVALFELAAARIDAARWGITSVHREENYIVLQYSDPALIEQLAKQATSELRIVDGRSAYVPLPQNARSGSDVFDLVRRLLATGTQRGSADLTGCIEARGERSDFQSNQAVDRGGRAFGAP